MCYRGALCAKRLPGTLFLCLSVLEDEKLLYPPEAPVQLSGPFSKGSVPSLHSGLLVRELWSLSLAGLKSSKPTQQPGSSPTPARRKGCVGVT